MKGLLVKDFRLLSNQKRFFWVILFITVTLLATGTEPYVIIGYGTLISTVFTISTIRYDEFNNGNAFLFTMPFTRKNYVTEKYLFGFLAGGSVCIVLTVVTGIMTAQKNLQSNMVQWIITAFAFLVVMLLMLSILIPLELKFGSEKSRIALMAVVIVFAAAGGVIGELCKQAGLDVEKFFIEIGMLNFYILFMAGVLLTVAVTAISILISFGIMKKKQF